MRCVNKKQGMAFIIDISEEKTTKMVLSIIFSTIGGLLQLVPFISVYYIVKELLLYASGAELNEGVMIWWALNGAAGLAGGLFVTYIGGMMGHKFAYRVICGVRLKVINHIGKLPMGFKTSNSIGKIKHVVETDINNIEGFLSHQFPDMISTIVTVGMMFVTMFLMNIWLALASLVPIILGFVTIGIMMQGDDVKKSISDRFDAAEEINASSIEYVRGMPSIKIFGQTVRSFKDFHTVIVNFQESALKMATYLCRGNAVFQTVISSIATFIVPIGLLLLNKNMESVSFVITFFFFLIFAQGLTSPILKLLNFAEEMNVLNESIDRITDILDQKVSSEPLHGKEVNKFYIEFDNVSFGYEKEGNQILNNVTFTAPQGKITALVGPSGAGKSTIAQLIPRFWDIQQGDIRIGGTSIYDMKMDKLMNIMSFVFQESFLFADTLFNNIKIGNPNATDNDVYRAAKMAQCDKFIEKLPQGYQTIVGERGVYLSGGEQQRISVARAILKNAPILVLDEATAYADPENEYEMQLALQELIVNKTVIIIAHRLATICEADQILVVKEGQIAERGTHVSLLDRSGAYKQMWDIYTETETWSLSNDIEGVGTYE